MKLRCNPVDQAGGTYETEDSWPIKSDPQQPVEPSEVPDIERDGPLAELKIDEHPGIGEWLVDQPGLDELTHVIAWEHIGLDRLHVPRWVWEGLADYVGIENRETFKQLQDALGDRPVDTPMRIKYGSYPRYRLLVTYFVEKQGWSIDQLLHTRLTEDEATEIMRADATR